MLTNLILADLLLRGFGIRSRHFTPRGSQRPFRVEHVVSYPNHYSPALACSAIPYPLPLHTLRSSFTRPAHPDGRTTGLPSSMTLTRWGGCCLSTDGTCVSVSRVKSGTSDRMPFWLRRIQLFSPVHFNDSYSSSRTFTRPPGLAPHPPIAGRLRNRSSRIDSAACAGLHCPGALDGSLRNPP